MFEDMPMVTYDSEETGWHHIYNGILSPFATKYKAYIKSELKTRVQKKESANQSERGSTG